ncbi:hypothetical protein SEVIR_4G293000v4 [Setaria viridis]|uniref:J domain-containing protein n=1 Tax=Setaria viridis TaxID=4556 RepID=A0A4U6V2X6_SETVI|nr:chaperone protein dnaJ 11, chloroplastic-like [Setaria viridis]TKW23451.1 hypothetical protein SEVIR_4G293000v2 [Setaria viridis]
MAASFASTASVVPSCGAAGARRGGRFVARASAVAMAPALGTTARTHYEVLGVGTAASRGEVKAAYRRLAREVHPDAGGRGDEGFIRLHAAYATLADPDERARYDRSVARPAPARAVGFRPRRWETDQCW